MTDSTYNFHLEETLVLQPLNLTEPQMLREAPWYMEGADHLSPRAISGTPLPYTIAGDDALVIVLLLTVLTGLRLVTSSWQYMSHALMEFFAPTRHQNIYDVQTSDSVLHGGVTLLLFASLAEGGALYTLLHHFSLIGTVLPSELNTNLLLMCCIAGSLGLWILKIVCYGLVNPIFFEAGVRREWREGQRLLALLSGTLMCALALTSASMEAGSPHLLWGLILAVGVVKCLTLIKAEHTFFPGLPNLLHLILYFCTLELAPLALLTAILTF